ncbi:GMC family oxidoreductase [Streptomyces sp. NBC_00878]|uniref:GMC family oxidoreductase n=1 Tax=Streptomyces sp. NBC_00878 TaxID=2975854 RepID=UPI00225B5483|nr:GMC family oxidoreductase N-terminal domain-containing protein [Streptomyces sp. NBC_00878]MCX4911144.1 GMC family oxidoreductase N-terminal domain-containing protein [Streptomyces sp. NBC_00878]
MTALTSDYVVVGGGTAGCVLAARLSRDPGTRVVLLEAGESSGPAEMSYPDPLAAFSLWGSSVDWAYSTTAQPGTEDAVHPWPRGKVLGGSSAINGMVHHRGHPDSYDVWEKQGATDWNYDSLLPFFRRSETVEGRDPYVRGTDGPMRIEAIPAPNPLAEAAFCAAAEAGHTPLEDGNGWVSEGVSWRETNVAEGRRQSAADAYLLPVLARPNLTVITGAHARRLLVEGGRCRGVEYTVAGEVRTVLADRETVLAAGAIGSPQLLMLSGIGPADHLRETGIEVLADLPGVGGNLHDHVTSYVVHTSDQQPPSGPTAEVQVLTRSSAGVAPDLLLLFAGAALRPRWTGADPGGHSILFSLMDPSSRGTLRLRSADPAAPPLMDPAYLSDDRDLDRLVVGLRLARELGGTKALAPWRTGESFPGADVQDDESCRAYLRSTASTYFHPVGTCRIGTDELAVVDPQLRVRSVAGLRIADASVMPSIASAPTNATVLAIAERAAHFMTGSPGLVP